MRGNQQEQVLFRSAVDVIDQGVCLLDRASMRVIDVNETACRMLGYSRSELFAGDPADFDIGSSEQLATIFDALIAGGSAYTQTAQLRRKDGSTLAVMIDWRALRVVDNWTIVGVISARSDQAG
ncbi:MAG: PAS domain-containing protein [Oxalobacteraceae bacterium]|nr:PAS domain-containing protein [Oxalobacteraceae bacterium]